MTAVPLLGANLLPARGVFMTFSDINSRAFAKIVNDFFSYGHPNPVLGPLSTSRPRALVKMNTSSCTRCEFSNICFH